MLTGPTKRGHRLARSWLAAAAALASVAMAPPVRAADPDPDLSVGGGASRRLLVIGVLAHRPKAQVLAGWEPLSAALDRALPDHRFLVEALDYPELEVAIAERRVDLVITNPGHYVAIRTRQPMSGVLATVIEQGPGASLAGFGGIIFVRADRRDLTGLASLAGARIAAVGTSSLGGYQAQAYELALAGIGLPAGERLLLTGVPHDKVFQAVLSGQADAGFARTGTLEQLAAEGRIDASALRVLHRQPAADFPYAISTRLYPEWPVVALDQVGADVSRRIAAALLQLEHADRRPVAAGAAYHGFTIPADYGPVEAALRELRLPPFDGLPAFGLRDVLRRYGVPLAALGAAGAIIALLAAFLVLANRRLVRARRDADVAAATLRTALAGNEDTLADLREALSRVKQLSGLLPICMYCHKIRTDLGYWDRLEVYISAHTDAHFSHGICPACLDRKHPPDP